jgi:hypothetical protein
VTSLLTRRIERAEAATLPTAARVHSVATDEIAADLWATAQREGKPAGLIVVSPGQAQAVITGATIADLMRSVADRGIRIHDTNRPRTTNDGSYLWQPPAGAQPHSSQRQ